MGNLGGYCMGLLCSITGQNIVALRGRRESEAEKKVKIEDECSFFPYVYLLLQYLLFGVKKRLK